MHRERDDLLVANAAKKDGSFQLGDPAIKLGLWIAN